MVEQSHQSRLGYAEFDPGGNIADHGIVPYQLRRAARTDAYQEEPVPLFLSDYNGEPDPSEYHDTAPAKRRFSMSSRILAAVVAAAAVAVLFALFTSDATQGFMGNVKSSIAALLPAPSAAAQSDPSQLTQRDRRLNAAPQAPATEQAAALRTVATAGASPTREEIKTAYQSALQSGFPQAALTETAVPAEPIHQLAPAEIAALQKRADALIASGDIAAARLVLRRAADAGDARAAMTIAETYDPAILEKLAVHGVVPDLAMARGWYEKAKKYGASEATQRLDLLANRQH
jgi:hypothetical protein